MSQLEHLNGSLQQQLREREEQMLDLTMELDRLRAGMEFIMSSSAHRADCAPNRQSPKNKAGLRAETSPLAEVSEDISDQQQVSLKNWSINMQNLVEPLTMPGFCSSPYQLSNSSVSSKKGSGIRILRETPR